MLKMSSDPDSRLLLFCAFRYALGRKTYVSEFMVNVIINNFNILLDHDLKQIKREILLCPDLGMSCDEEQWHYLCTQIDGELILRGNVL